MPLDAITRDVLGPGAVHSAAADASHPVLRYSDVGLGTGSCCSGDCGP